MLYSPTIRRCGILHIEDNIADSVLLQEALAHLSYVTFAHAFTLADGLKTIRERPWDDKINLIILDWNLPKTEGTEVLLALKNDEGLRPIPVIVLTGSTNPKTIADAYRGFASCVLHKPADLDGLARTAAEIEHFWLQTAQLPFCDHPGKAFEANE